MNIDDRKNIERLFDLGHDAFISKDYEKSIEYLDEIINIYNKDIIAYSDSEFIIYSDSYDNEDDEEGKNINNEDINTTHDTLVDVYYNRGLSYFNLKKYDIIF